MTPEDSKKKKTLIGLMRFTESESVFLFFFFFF